VKDRVNKVGMLPAKVSNLVVFTEVDGHFFQSYLIDHKTNTTKCGDISASAENYGVNVFVELLIVDRTNGWGKLSENRLGTQSADRWETKALIKSKEKLTSSKSKNQCYDVQVIGSIASQTICSLKGVFELIDYLPDTGTIAQCNVDDLPEPRDILLRDGHEKMMVVVKLGQHAHVLTQFI
jgi:hypothetical protein